MYPLVNIPDTSLSPPRSPFTRDAVQLSCMNTAAKFDPHLKRQYERLPDQYSVPNSLIRQLPFTASHVPVRPALPTWLSGVGTALSAIFLLTTSVVMSS